MWDLINIRELSNEIGINKYCEGEKSARSVFAQRLLKAKLNDKREGEAAAGFRAWGAAAVTHHSKAAGGLAATLLGGGGRARARSSVLNEANLVSLLSEGLAAEHQVVLANEAEVAAGDAAGAGVFSVVAGVGSKLVGHLSRS